MIADDIDGPSSRTVDGRDLAAELRWRKLVDRREHEVHRHLQFTAVLTVVLLQLGYVRGPGLADQHSV